MLACFFKVVVAAIARDQIDSTFIVHSFLVYCTLFDKEGDVYYVPYVRRAPQQSYGSVTVGGDAILTRRRDAVLDFKIYALFTVRKNNKNSERSNI